MADNDSFGRDVSSKRQAIADQVEKQTAELIAAFKAAIPDSREKSVAITQFETANLWARQAIASATIGAD